MDNESSNNFSVAQKLQGQFRFYVVSLNFTLLAASVQTAKLGESRFEDVAEILAWVALLLAGLAALWYIEWEPLIRERLAHRSNYVQQLIEAKKAKLQGVDNIFVLETGENQSIETRISNLEKSRDTLTASADALQKKNYAKYAFARTAFIAGLVLLIVARSAAAMSDLFGYQLW